jgi:YbbR domain-containing protein
MSRVIAALAENWQWKLLSLIAATMLWLALVDSPELTATVRVPLEFTKFPGGLAFSGSVPGEVELQLRGPKNAMTQAESGPAAVTLDLGRIRKPGEYTFRVEDGLAGIPPNVRLVTAIPNQIRLVLEPQIQREVPVRLRIGGLKNHLGYRIVKTEIQPPRLIVSGPESRVQAVEAVYTDLLEFATIDVRDEEPVVEARLQGFVEDPRVKIESNPAVRVRVHLQRISD